MIDFWNGWRITKVANWYHGQRPDQRGKWVHETEVPLGAAIHQSNEMYVVRWLNETFPRNGGPGALFVRSRKP